MLRQSDEVFVIEGQELHALPARPLRTGLFGERLQQVLDWAVDQGFFLEARAKNPVFGLRGRSGVRLVSFSPDWIYCHLHEKYYPGGAGERDELVTELKSLGMLDPDLDLQDVASGRNMTRKLTDLGDEELRAFLDLLSRFCQTSDGT